jgi:hypothetical protein
MSTSNLNAYREEVEAGLPNEIAFLDRALERQAYYDYEGQRYERRFRRDAESSFDFQGRSHRQSGFLRETIGKLCAHLYNPGPSRRWSEPSGDEFLQKVYRDNLINSLMLRADCLSTLNDVVAIQIDAGEGDFERKPLTYRLWAREQFCAWCDGDEPTIPVVVCTKDLFDGQMRYRLWNDEEVWTFLSKKLDPGTGGGEPTSGGRVARLEKKEPHDYGCLPFSFIHYELPIQQFYGVAIGEFLMGAEVTIDNRLMLLDESIQKYLNPIPVAEGVDELWKPNIEPGRWIRMPLANPRLDSGGNYVAGDYAKLYYVQASIEVQAAWEDLRNYIDQALEAAEIPKSSVRMEQMGVASGISLMVEQEPLLKRAENRRAGFTVYETDLAQRSLTCAGNHYGKSELVAAGEKGDLVAAWPQARMAVNTPDKLDLALQEEAAKLKSRLMTIMDWYGVGREEALELAKQIEQDNIDLVAAAPALTAPPDPENEPENPNGVPNIGPTTEAHGKEPDI